jgi:hypothetical protein
VKRGRENEAGSGKKRRVTERQRDRERKKENRVGSVALFGGGGGRGVKVSDTVCSLSVPQRVQRGRKDGFRRKGV